MHITSLGWLFRMHKDFLLQPFKLLLHDTVKSLAPNQLPQIQFGLTYTPIYYGTTWQEYEKNQLQGKWAVHVEATVEIAFTSKAYLKKALLSPSIKAFTNLPLLLDPILQKKWCPAKKKTSNA